MPAGPPVGTIQRPAVGPRHPAAQANCRDEAFMAMALVSGGLDDISAVVRYPAAFDGVRSLAVLYGLLR